MLRDRPCLLFRYDSADCCPLARIISSIERVLEYHFEVDCRSNPGLVGAVVRNSLIGQADLRHPFDQLDSRLKLLSFALIFRCLAIVFLVQRHFFDSLVNRK